MPLAASDFQRGKDTRGTKGFFGFPDVCWIYICFGGKVEDGFSLMK